MVPGAITWRSAALPDPANPHEGAVRQMRSSLRYLYPTFVSGGESGGAGLLVGVAVLEVALRRKVVVDRGMD